MIKCYSKRWHRFFDGAFVDFQDDDYILICDKCKKRVKKKSLEDIVNYEETKQWKSIVKNNDAFDYCNKCWKEETKMTNEEINVLINLHIDELENDIMPHGDQKKRLIDALKQANEIVAISDFKNLIDEK